MPWVHELLCIYFALQKPQANELSSEKKKEKKSVFVKYSNFEHRRKKS